MMKQPRTIKQILEDMDGNAETLKSDKEIERDTLNEAIEKLEDYRNKVEEVLPDLEELSELQEELWTTYEVDIS